jgi:hypothetical protein
VRGIRILRTSPLNFAFWGFSEVQRIGSLPAAFFMKMV